MFYAVSLNKSSARLRSVINKLELMDMPSYSSNSADSMNPEDFAALRSHPSLRLPETDFPQQYRQAPLSAKIVPEDLPGRRTLHRRIPCSGCRKLSPFNCTSAFSPGEEIYANPAELITEPCCDHDGCAVFNARRRSSFWPGFARPRWLNCDELYHTASPLE